MSKTEKHIVTGEFLRFNRSMLHVGSTAWFEWLAQNTRFIYRDSSGSYTARCESRRGKPYWYAYKRIDGRLQKMYLGKAEEMSLERLRSIGLLLVNPELAEPEAHRKPPEPLRYEPETRIDTTLLPMIKLHVPALPVRLLSRPRLVAQIRPPLTIIYAPSGFGKTTLVNEWQKSAGIPVGWLSLDRDDNQVIRFWYLVVMAIQTIVPDFGGLVQNYLRTATPVVPKDVVARLTNDILSIKPPFPRFALVLDDFHKINHPEIIESVQLWVERLPENIQLILLGQSKPAISLGHLRSRSLVTELDATDLRFNAEEGISYLLQYPQDPPLAYDDLERMVKHAEGWATGLTLAAQAMGKYEDRRQFIDTFSGAHTYLSEYFMESVLGQYSTELQEFLLKTSVLNNFTGDLCDSVTGQTGSARTLEKLYEEKLFIVELGERGWYRYHDLFGEMLQNRLKGTMPDLVPELHRRAARWYIRQHAAADAINHLLSSGSWDEAATLMEEMAIMELEHFGEDSRLLRWLQELPVNAVQSHKKLLYVYLRLAEVALPRKKVEKLIGEIELNISSRPADSLTPDEIEVLTEVRAIRQAFEKGEPLKLSSTPGEKSDPRWEVLNRMAIIRRVFHTCHPVFEDELSEFLQQARAQKNLFAILLVGGTLSRRLVISGYIRKCERTAREVLELAMSWQGRLPEPASIALVGLCQAQIERNDLELARRYLEQALAVDPNPTSTNMAVQTGIMRAKIQQGLGQLDEAIVTMKAVRDLHQRRPSGVWLDDDLLAMEALLYVRKGDIATAERLLIGVECETCQTFIQYIQAEIYLQKGMPVLAEEILRKLVLEHPEGIFQEPTLLARVVLSLSLYEQQKVNQAVNVISEALRLAAPESYRRPFLEFGTRLVPLLMVTLHSIDLNSQAQSFARDVLQILDPSSKNRKAVQNDVEMLKTSALVSTRELEVLQLVLAGNTNREIARQLSVSESTIKTHLEKIYDKLNVNNRTQAILRAQELRLV